VKRSIWKTIWSAAAARAQASVRPRQPACRAQPPQEPLAPARALLRSPRTAPLALCQGRSASSAEPSRAAERPGKAWSRDWHSSSRCASPCEAGWAGVLPWCFAHKTQSLDFFLISSLCSCRQDDAGMDYSAETKTCSKQLPAFSLHISFCFHPLPNLRKFSSREWEPVNCASSIEGDSSKKGTKQHFMKWRKQWAKQNDNQDKKTPTFNNFSNAYKIFSKEQLLGQVYSLSFCSLPSSLRL